MRGFTMIELVTILVIVGIMAVFVLPRLDLLRGYDEAGFRDKVVAALQFARKAAIAQRHIVQAIVEDDNVRFQIQSNPPETQTFGPWFNLALPFSEVGCAASTICHPKNVALTPVAPLSSPATIEFDAQGRATKGGGTYTIGSVGTGASPVSFVVENETGYVH